MAKKQIQNYKFYPGVQPPPYGLYPNAVALLTANKTFLIEEMSQYIKNRIIADASTPASPFYNYNYDATRELKCKRDYGYVLDAFIYDLTYGGTSLTVAVGERYRIDGVAQVISVDVEVETHTYIRDIIEDIFTNTPVTVLNLEDVDQTILADDAELFAYDNVLILADSVIGYIDGSSTLVSSAPDSQNGGLLPNAVAFLEDNKRFLQEETIAYIQDSIDNAIAPFINFTYNAEKCRRDVSYIIEGYITDLKHGGNRQTVFNAGKYWENGVAQVDGDRQPEIAAHIFLRDLIENYVWTNTLWIPKNTIAGQSFDFNNPPEVSAFTRIKELSNIVLDVIEFGLDRLPDVVSNRGYIKLPGFFKTKDFLLITNATRNVIMYNFADPTLSADVTTSENFDESFAGALFGVDKITTVTFDVDTTNMMVTDEIQVFVEGKEQTVRLNSIATDAMERQKVGIPQSMLDADFEYGLQPTKWQAIALMRNYPSIYEIPGTDIPVINVVTNASAPSGIGASQITVTTQGNHGLVSGDPITIKALSTSVQGFSRAEGTFLVFTVPSTSTFTFFAKSKVGTTNGEVLASTYTQLRKGGYYTGSSVGSPSFNVVSNGSSGTLTTSLITPSGSTTIGFSSSPPPLGAPLTGTGVVSGTQITAVTGAGGVVASTTLTTNASIGATTLTVNSTTSLGPGLIFNRGDGVAVRVTDVSGSVVTLSSPLTSAIVGTNQTFNGVTGSSSGGGVGATFNVSRTPTYAVSISNPGSGYAVSDTITILGSNLGGTSPTNDATITVTGATVLNSIASLDFSSGIGGSGYSDANGVATTVSPSGGTGATVNITTVGGVVGSITLNAVGQNYAPGNTLSIGPSGRINTTTNLVGGSGYVTANGLSTTVSPSGGTGATVNIVANAIGGVATATLTTPGTGYTAGTLTTTYGGAGVNFSVTITETGGVIDGFTINAPGSGYSVNDVVTINGGNNDATITINSVTNGAITSVTIVSQGSGYSPGNTLTVVQGGGAGGTFDVLALHAQSTINVLTVTTGGVIQSVSISGTAITAPSQDFISAITISDPTTAQIADGNTGITFSAISTIEVTFTSAHGFVPGNTITAQITSSGSNAQLAAGPFFVESVPTPTTLRYTARASGSVDNSLVGSIFGRPDSFFIHRPFDGGVQLGTAGPAHGAVAIRMSKKYIRYQSGKGVMYNTGALFAPSYDIRTITATGTAIGSTITIITDDNDHGCQVGGVIVISGVTTSGYNGTYTVASVTNERQLSFVATKTLGSTSPVLGSPCQMSIKNWHGSTVRSGIFDDQNGMFYQYDGQRLAVVQRSSTFQIAGSISINANSNIITGSSTRFTQQLATGDRIVIRGMTHVVSSITSDTFMTVTPDFRGISNVSNVKITKTVDKIVPQEDWNLDPCNGSGPSGYNIDITKMQMIGIQHTWYGAGFIDFMLRGPEGNYIFVHRFRNSNVNSEAYMRTGNQPVRYEVINEGARGRLSVGANTNDTTLFMSEDDLYYFPNSGVVYVDNELISYTGKSATGLTGCTRAATMTQFVAGSTRTFSAGPVDSHPERTGVVLVSNTITPIISHWGSAFMIDGQFDSDRGYIFNYAQTGISATVDRTTAFLIRLAPSVSNAITGDLGERELLNRAQLLLSSIAVTSDTVTGGGAIVVEGVLNPINYPVNPANITWTGLTSQAAGGQPSFAQVAAGGSVTWSGNIFTTTATVQGSFSTTFTVPGINGVNTSLTAISLNTVTASLTAVGIGTTVTALSFNAGQPFGGNTYQRAVNNGRNDILITNTEYDALPITINVGDSITAAGIINEGTTITAITRAYLGSIYTRIVMSQNGAIDTPQGAGNNVTVTINGTYGRAISSSRSDFLVANTQFSALTSSLRSGDGLSATTFLVGGQTVSSTTSSFITFNGVPYTRIVMSGNGSANSTRSTSIGSNNVSLTVTIAASQRFNTAISASRNDFIITQTQLNSVTIAATDILSAATFLTGGQTISSITPNFQTISGTAYARIIMSANGSSTSTSGAGNNVTITSTTAASSTYTRAFSTTRSDFLIADSAFTGQGVQTSDVVSIAPSNSFTLASVQITGTAGQFSCTATTLFVGERVTISGTFGGTGSISGYSNPTTYFIVATNGSTTFTLSTTEGGAGVTTTAGTPTGLTYTVTTFVNINQTIQSITPSFITLGGTPYTRIVMSGNANANSAAGAGNNVTVTITAANTAAAYTNRNFLFFTSASWLASGAVVGTRVATSFTQFPAGTAVTQVSTRTFGATTIYLVTFNQSANTTINAAGTVTFQFGAAYALPGEQVFSFIANPGESVELSLEALKELTATAIGGRGSFPNGPDVLAINVYKVAGTATNTNVILRWSEAQA